MLWFWLIVLVLSPAILYAIALATVPFWSWKCPRCRRRSLNRVGGYLWHGRKGGGSVSFYQCRHCFHA